MPLKKIKAVPDKPVTLENGTYICAAFNPRCFIIQKVSYLFSLFWSVQTNWVWIESTKNTETYVFCFLTLPIPVLVWFPSIYTEMRCNAMWYHAKPHDFSSSITYMTTMRWWWLLWLWVVIGSVFIAQRHWIVHLFVISCNIVRYCVVNHLRRQ